jgi:hypothetical protein
MEKESIRKRARVSLSYQKLSVWLPRAVERTNSHQSGIIQRPFRRWTGVLTFKHRDGSPQASGPSSPEASGRHIVWRKERDRREPERSGDWGQ